MPTKNVNDALWRKVETETVRAVVATKTAFKDTEIMHFLIEKGLETITDEDYEKHAKRKKGKK